MRRQEPGAGENAEPTLTPSLYSRPLPETAPCVPELRSHTQRTVRRVSPELPVGLSRPQGHSTEQSCCVQK